MPDISLVNILGIAPPYARYPLGIASLKGVFQINDRFNVNDVDIWEIANVSSKLHLEHTNFPAEYNFIPGMEVIPVLLAVHQAFLRSELLMSFLNSKVFLDIIQALGLSPFEFFNDLQKALCTIEKWVFNTAWGDIVGFSILESNLLATTIASLFLRNNNPDCKIVFGGPSMIQSQYLRELALNLELCDFIVISEGELTFPLLCDYITKTPTFKLDHNIKDIPNVAYLNSDFNYQETPIQYVKNLDTLPTPDLSGFHSWHNKAVALGYVGNSFAPIYASRGCPHHCNFCSEWDLFGPKFRTRSPIRVVDDLEYYSNALGLWGFRFCDSLLDWSPKWLNELCKEIIDREIDIIWGGYMSLQSLTQEEAFLLRQAGFLDVTVGLEGTSDETLKELGKGKKLQNFSKRWQSIDNSLQAGITTRVNVMLGPASQTFYSVFNHLQQIKKLRENHLPIYTGPISILNIRLGSHLFDTMNPNKIITWRTLFPALSFLFQEKKYNRFLDLPATTNGTELDYPLMKLVRWREILMKSVMSDLTSSYYDLVSEYERELKKRILPPLKIYEMKPRFSGNDLVEVKQVGIHSLNKTYSIRLPLGKGTLTEQEIGFLKNIDGSKSLKDILTEVNLTKENSEIILDELIYPLTAFGIIKWFIPNRSETSNQFIELRNEAKKITI